MFGLARFEGFPSMFGHNRTPVTVDLDEIFILFVFIVLLVTGLAVTLGYGKKKSLCAIFKVGVSVFIGGSLMISNYGQEWEVSHIETKTPYRAGVSTEIYAAIGIKIGLRSVNVTLKANPKPNTPLAGETIDYNERFPWTWDQGRFGFGPNSGLLQRTFREAQRKGLPIPILWVVDYFIIDGENIRFGRFYRTAGWYCHILLWAALPAWILANIFLQSVGRYAAYFTGLVGFLELLSCIIWASVRNPIPLEIPFEQATLKTTYGFSFWLALSTGILSLLIAAVLIVMDLRCPNVLSNFLGINILDQYDEYVVRANELDYMRDKTNKDGSMELGRMSAFPDKDDGVVLLKRRSTVKRAQKDLLRVGYVPVKIPHYDDVYYNHPVNPGTSNDGVESDERPLLLPRRKKMTIN
ncbi:dual oxidase maturation factor 1 [Fopius arisanus]|uniref:Dual oxidase maturation factor 1 n=1 Tax=Fopius arisanus TaxID=64838 RepID=A0A9R1THP2_9HYME|nr:PREDICTED: dual oxidase maturation factor 1-like [Fopius arisanus]